MPSLRGRPLSRPVRAFIEERLLRGDSQKAIRDAANSLRRKSEGFLKVNWPKWERLRGKRKVITGDVYRVYDALRKSPLKAAAYSERKRLRESWKTETIAERALARDLHVPEPTLNKQIAHDAGVLYRASKDERYREYFQEGSRL